MVTVNDIRVYEPLKWVKTCSLCNEEKERHLVFTKHIDFFETINVCMDCEASYERDKKIKQILNEK